MSVPVPTVKVNFHAPDGKEIEEEIKERVKSPEHRDLFRKAFNAINIVFHAKASIGVWGEATVHIRGKGRQKLTPVYGRTLKEASELMFKRLVKLARDIKETFVDLRTRQEHLGRQPVVIPIPADDVRYLG